ncbi:MAG: Hsp20/alpha crystallin family protein [Acidobacteria bacterium]|nr:Hsp20/alpha crystallin family protein [Acidobacteriota bacterium]
MSIQRWDPLRDLLGLQERMNRLFQESMTRSRPGEENVVSMSGWSPSVDIYETDNDIVIKAELPEVDRKDLDVRIENNTLSIHGERKFDHEVKQENYLRMERSYGAFFRAFTLPNGLDTENVDATFKDGVLKLTLRKKAESRARSIKIESA